MGLVVSGRGRWRVRLGMSPVSRVGFVFRRQSQRELKKKPCKQGRGGRAGVVVSGRCRWCVPLEGPWDRDTSW